MMLVQMRKYALPVISLIGIVIVVTALIMWTGGKPLQDKFVIPGRGPAAAPLQDTSSQSWKDVLLQDVTSSRTFTVREFEGKPVLLFTFTTWCSICTAQQNEIRDLQARSPGTFTTVAVDIDPYEDEDIVRKHLSDNRFLGLYVVAPPEMTRYLTGEFGLGMITPANAPMVLICSNGTVTRLGNGVKPAEDLNRLITSRC